MRCKKLFWYFALLKTLFTSQNVIHFREGLMVHWEECVHNICSIARYECVHYGRLLYNEVSLIVSIQMSSVLRFLIIVSGPIGPFISTRFLIYKAGKSNISWTYIYNCNYLLNKSPLFCNGLYLLTVFCLTSSSSVIRLTTYTHTCLYI